MKTKVLLFIFSILFIFTSCRKDETEPIMIDDSTAESINPKMYETEISYTKNIVYFKDNRGGDMYYGVKSDYTWQVHYRFAEGESYRDLVFYPIEKSWKVKGVFYESQNSVPGDTVGQWNHEQNWCAMDCFYRYDESTLNSYIYSSIADKNPRLIMNFNLEIGDTWIFDNEKNIGIKVLDKFSVSSNGLIYPALKVKFYKQNESMKFYSYKDILLTPLNPNPALIGADLDKFWTPDWSVFQSNGELQPTPNWIPREIPTENSIVLIKWNTSELENYANTYKKDGFAFYSK